jgi:O-antigen/teichoic acid export membrane protein
VTLATGIVLARSLGPDGRGAYQAVVLWPQVLGWISTLGFTKATAYYRALGEGERRGLVGNALLVCMATGGVFALAAVPIVGRLLDGYSGETVSLAATMLWFVPLIAFANVLEGLLEGARAFRTLSAIRVATPALGLAGLLFLWANTRVTVKSATGVYAMSLVCMLVVLVGIVWWRGALAVRPEQELLVKTGRYAAQYYPYMLADLALGFLDQILLIPALPAAAVGLYVVATRAMVVAELPGAMSQVLFASIPGLSRSESRPVIARAIKGGGILSGVLAVVLFVFAEPILRLLYGEAFAEAAAPFRILIVGAFAMGIRKIVGEALGGLGQPRANSVIQVGSTIVLAMLLLVTVPKLGIVGAAWSVTIAHVLNLAAGLLWLFVRTEWTAYRT